MKKLSNHAKIQWKAIEREKIEKQKPWGRDEEERKAKNDESRVNNCE